MTDQTPSILVHQLEQGGWEVLITPAGFDEPIRVTGFKSEKNAIAWMEREARKWCTAHRIAA